jgi:enoyl-CoA hydratase/carnithine racemase
LPSEVETSVRDSVAWVTLNRSAKRNAITGEMWDVIRSALTDFRQRADVRAVAIQGTDGCFTAGADLASIKDADGNLSASYHEKAFSALAAIREFPRPTVALIDGPCIGAGCSVALSCDVRLASSTSTFGVPGVTLGIIYEQWSVARLVDLIGSGRTSRFLLTAQRVSAAAAESMGLIELCTDNLLAEGEALLRALCSGDPEAIAGTRRIIRALGGPAEHQPVAGT